MLTPVAVSGVAKGYPYEVAVAWDNSELSRSAIGKAIKTGRTFISRDIDSSPDYLPWKKTILKYGLKSSIAVPLVIGKEIIGGFVIYSTEEDAFDNEEVRLLEELGEDISYGILSLRLEAQLEHQSGVLSSIRRHLSKPREPVISSVALLINSSTSVADTISWFTLLIDDRTPL